MENVQFKGLDWEIEDLLSDRILLAFDQAAPTAVSAVRECGGRRHRDFTRDGKYRLHDFVKTHAGIDDVVELLKLIRALRDYFRLQADHIIC
jgi:hypothetical protein